MSDDKRKADTDLWVTAPLQLDRFCIELQQALNLPEFEFDAENAWEWGVSRIENETIEINVTRMHDNGDSLLDAPIHVRLLISGDAPSTWKQTDKVKSFVAECGQAMADTGNIEAYSGRVRYLHNSALDFGAKQVFKPKLTIVIWRRQSYRNADATTSLAFREGAVIEIMRHHGSKVGIW